MSNDDRSASKESSILPILRLFVRISRNRRINGDAESCTSSDSLLLVGRSNGQRGWKSLSNDFLSLYKGVRGGTDEDLPNKAARLIWLQLENDRFHETVHTRIIRRNQASRPASNNVNNWKSNQNRLLQFDGADWSVRYRLQSLQTACLPSSSLPPALKSPPIRHPLYVSLR